MAQFNNLICNNLKVGDALFADNLIKSTSISSSSTNDTIVTSKAAYNFITQTLVIE